MRLLLGFAAVACLSGAGPAPPRPDTSGAKAQGPQAGSVVVTVLEAGTRLPIPNARVRVNRADFVTGPDGRVRLHDVEPGPQWVFVDSPEHLSTLEPSSPRMFDRFRHAPAIDARQWVARNPDSPGTLPLTVVAGAEVAIEFLLPRGAAIAGEVLTSDGTPVRDNLVDVLELYDESSDSRTFVTAARTKTDAAGRFHAPGLLPSTYYVRVNVNQADSHVRVPTFYPSETNPKMAAAIELRGSETKVVPITIRDIRPARIAGRVLNARGEPVTVEHRPDFPRPRPSIEVAMRRLDENCCSDVIGWELLEVDARGRFSTGRVPPGKYVLRSGRNQVPVVIDSADVDDVVIQLHTPALVTGRIVADGTSGPADGELGLRLEAADGRPLSADYSVTKIGADGSFAIEAAPGQYRFAIRPPEGWAGMAVMLKDGQDVLKIPVGLSAGNTLADVRVLLTDRVAQIRGGVGPPDMLGLRGYEVIAFPVASHLWHKNSPYIHEVWSDEENGRFTLADVQVGTDYLIAVHPWGARRPAIPFEQWLEDLARSAVRVTVAEPRVYTVDIDLARRK